MLALGDLLFREQIGDCNDAAAFVAGAPERARRHARRLMDLMADTLSGALLVEEAAYGTAAGDGRKAAVARLFVAARLNPPARRGIAPVSDDPHRYFDALAGYETLDIGAAGDRVATGSGGREEERES